MHEPITSFQRAKFATLIVCLLSMSFLTFFQISKHDPTLSAVNPFIDDLYDAVGSFGIQLAMLSALVAFVRILRPYPDGVTSDHIQLILHGGAVSLLAIAVTLTADGIAMVRHLPAWTGSSAGWLLAACIGALLLFAVPAGWMVIHIGRSVNMPSEHRPWGRALAVCLVGSIVLMTYPEAWRASVPGAIVSALAGMVLLFILTYGLAKLVFPSAVGPCDDVLDGLPALYRWAKVHAHWGGGIFRWMEKLAGVSRVRAAADWFNPRKHTWRFVIPAALGMGIALVLAEAIGEGAPQNSAIPMVLAVFIGLEGAGVLLGYVLFRRFLGIFRSESAPLVHSSTPSPSER
jgi:hypothetical protein